MSDIITHKNELTLETQIKEAIGFHMRNHGGLTITDAVGAIEAVKLEVANPHDEIDPIQFDSEFAKDLAKIIIEHFLHVTNESILGCLMLCQLDIGYALFQPGAGVDKLAHHVKSPLEM